VIVEHGVGVPAQVVAPQLQSYVASHAAEDVMSEHGVGVPVQPAVCQ
jgi:hypothetical protein